MLQEAAKINLDNLSNNLSREERIARIKAEKMERDYKIELAQARDEGIKKGIKEGIEKTNRNFITNLKSMGMPIETIMQVTKLTREEVESYMR